MPGIVDGRPHIVGKLIYSVNVKPARPKEVEAVVSELLSFVRVQSLGRQKDREFNLGTTLKRESNRVDNSQVEVSWKLKSRE